MAPQRLLEGDWPQPSREVFEATRIMVITDRSLRDNSTVSHGVPIMLLSALAIKVARLLSTPDCRYYLYDK